MVEYLRAQVYISAVGASSLLRYTLASFQTSSSAPSDTGVIYGGSFQQCQVYKSGEEAESRGNGKAPRGRV